MAVAEGMGAANMKGSWWGCQRVWEAEAAGDSMVVSHSAGGVARGSGCWNEGARRGDNTSGIARGSRK